MANTTIILAGEESIAAGIGNSSTVGSATCVRVFNSSGADVVIYTTDPTGANEYSGIGSITMPNDHVEYIQKRASYTIWGTGAFKAAKVGFTD